jgi:aromatic ring-cleaving dioxygenase
MWVDYDRLMDIHLFRERIEGKRFMVTVGAREGKVMVPHAKAVYEKFKSAGLS